MNLCQSENPLAGVNCQYGEPLPGLAMQKLVFSTEELVCIISQLLLWLLIQHSNDRTFTQRICPVVYIRYVMILLYRAAWNYLTMVLSIQTMLRTFSMDQTFSRVQTPIFPSAILYTFVNYWISSIWVIIIKHQDVSNRKYTVRCICKLTCPCTWYLAADMIPCYKTATTDYALKYKLVLKALFYFGMALA